MKTIYIHIGQTKTATTSLQSFFFNNKDWLEQNDILYPDIPEHYEIKSQHRYLAETFNTNHLDFDICINEWRYFIDQVKNSNCSKVLISEEVFWHLLEQYKEKRITAIKWIKERLEQWQVKIICYLRRQDHWVESWYNQLVKTDVSHISKLSFDEFIDKYDKFGLLDYHEVISNWATVFGSENIIVRPFETLKFKNQDIIDDFMEILNIDELGETIRHDQYLQLSLSNAACELAESYNKITDSAKYKEQFTKLLSSFDQSHKDKHRYIKSQKAHELLSKYSNSNYLLSQNFYLKKELFFNQTIHTSNFDYCGLSTKEIASFFATFFVEQQNLNLQLMTRIQELENHILK